MTGERSEVDPAFMIDEEPLLATTLGLAGEAIRREHHLRQELVDHRGMLDEQVLKQAQFLRSLISVKERRCDDLIDAMKGHQEDDPENEEQREARRWLKRVETIRDAFDRELESFEVVRYIPSGTALPERDEVRDVVDGSDKPSGTIIEVLRAAYLWRGSVLRPSKVNIAS